MFALLLHSHSRRRTVRGGAGAAASAGPACAAAHRCRGLALAALPAAERACERVYAPSRTAPRLVLTEHGARQRPPEIRRHVADRGLLARAAARKSDSKGGSIEQLITAFLFAFGFLLLVAIARPFKDLADDYFATACNFALTSLLFFSVILKVI